MRLLARPCLTDTSQLPVCDTGALLRAGLGKAAPSPPATLGSRADAGAGNQAASFGVEAELIRFSVGLEDTAQLTATFESALASLSAA